MARLYIAVGNVACWGDFPPNPWPNGMEAVLTIGAPINKTRQQRNDGRNTVAIFREMSRMFNSIHYAIGRHAGYERGHYHFSVKIGGRRPKTPSTYSRGKHAGKSTSYATAYRKNGKSAVASAAYRAGEKLYDERLMQNFDYTKKGGVVQSEILLPNGAPDWMRDRGKFWNNIESIEKRVDAQLYRELEISIPLFVHERDRELLVRGFILENVVNKYGVGADYAIHDPHRKNKTASIEESLLDGEIPWKQSQPHVHVMMSDRVISDSGFGLKNRELTKKNVLQNWRDGWEKHCNDYAEQNGLQVRIHSGTLEAQGIERIGATHENTATIHQARRWAEYGATVDAKKQIAESVRWFNTNIRPEVVGLALVGKHRVISPDTNEQGQPLYRTPDRSLTLSDFLTKGCKMPFPAAFDTMVEMAQRQAGLDREIEVEKQEKIKRIEAEKQRQAEAERERQAQELAKIEAEKAAAVAAAAEQERQAQAAMAAGQNAEREKLRAELSARINKTFQDPRAITILNGIAISVGVSPGEKPNDTLAATAAAAAGIPRATVESAQVILDQIDITMEATRPAPKQAQTENPYWYNHPKTDRGGNER
jgi:hypothetical protein